MSDVAPAIGIDLGTTNTCLAVFRFGKAEIIANNFGFRTTPSMVAFNENERLVGDAAKQQAHSNHLNTVFDAKRLIGCKFSDGVVQEDMKHWPFNIIDVDEIPKFKVTFREQQVIYSPEEISAMVLSEMKRIAELYLGKPVKSAVITVPAYFNDMQRKATKDAAEIADLKVLQIINEPTAACIAYGFHDVRDRERTVLVFDLGGGTFDVSVLKIKKKDFDVIATAGNTHLGGEDFDRRLVKYCIDDILRKHKIDIKNNKKALGKLRRACEFCKRSLSVQSIVNVEVDNLADGIDYKSTISRAKFEELNAELFESTIPLVELTLKYANLDKSAIEEIVLVGGSTRIPKIQKLVTDFFGKEPVKSINPDEVVGLGAAIIAAKLSGDKSDEIVKLILQDVTSLSLGVEVVGGIMSTIIKRNSKIPVKHTDSYVTSVNNQTSINFLVYQGESKSTKNNLLLGKFLFTDIPSAKQGVEKLDVTFDIDANGILDVSAVLRSTRKKINIIIETKGSLSKQQIDGMIKETRQLSRADGAKWDSNIARNELEEYCIKIKATVEKMEPSTDNTQILKKCAETIKWARENSTAGKEQCDEKKKNLRSFCARSFAKSF